MELDTVSTELIRNVPCDGLTLPVRIGGKVNIIFATCRTLEFINDFLFPLDYTEVRGKPIFDIYP